MILTVTFNPAVDMDFLVEDFLPGRRYRADVSRRSPGGAGINISIILRRLGQPSIASGFLAGFDGLYILEALRKEGISTNFIHTGGETRINVCIIDVERNVETRLHERGIEIPAQDRKIFLRNYERILTRAHAVCLGGSLPPGLNVSIYGEMVKMAKNASLPVVVHPTEDALEAALEEAPTVVKLDYQSRLSETGLAGQEEVNAFAKQALLLRGRGTQWVITSLSREKVAFASPGGLWIAENPLSEMRYVYATEDALLAGLLAGLQERFSSERAIRLAMACCRECATHHEKFPENRSCVEKLTSDVLLTKID
ncbi:MAG: PfkB family carbohydrate kinase [Synergistaceae bacterium]|jgi:1-phosphofructokinase family hexose kinase|nr:PfkB family carbohydrate kinase [Synergistaceae bacterium]